MALEALRDGRQRPGDQGVERKHLPRRSDRRATQRERHTLPAVTRPSGSASTVPHTTMHIPEESALRVSTFIHSPFYILNRS